MRASKFVLGAVLAASTVIEGQVAIRPGEYEYTLEMSMGDAKEAGMAVMDAAGFQKNKRRDCITPAEAKGDVAEMFAREMSMGDACKMSNVKTAGNQMTFTTVCEEDGLRMTMTTEMTFAGDAFSGVTTTKDPEGRVTKMKMSAQRIGDCR
jgi:Protein of unknown function (DUF3617)